MKTKMIPILILAIFSLSITSGVFATDKYIPTSIEEKQLNLKVNENFNIILESNPTTGYNWYSDYDSNYIKLVDQSYIPQDSLVTPSYSDYYIPDESLCGGGGKNVFFFKAIKTGETDIKMKYYRIWENCLPAKEVIYHIKITE